MTKWRKMIGAGGSDWKHYVRRKPHVVKRRIRKGIPDCLRGLVWQLISGSRDLLLMNPGVYEVVTHYNLLVCILVLDPDMFHHCSNWWFTRHQHQSSTSSGTYPGLSHRMFSSRRDMDQDKDHCTMFLKPTLSMTEMSDTFREWGSLPVCCFFI